MRETVEFSMGHITIERTPCSTLVFSAHEKQCHRHCSVLKRNVTQGNAMQRNATQCNTLQHLHQTLLLPLQHAATHNTMQHTVAHSSTCINHCNQTCKTRCNTLQYAATQCNTQQHTAPHPPATVIGTTTHSSAMQHTAIHSATTTSQCHRHRNTVATKYCTHCLGAVLQWRWQCLMEVM